MDLIDNKRLNHNVFFISEEISKLVETIQKTSSSKEVNLLKEKCCNEKSSISLTAFQGFTKLIESGVLNGPKSLSMLISLLPSLSHFSGLVETVGNLMLLDLRQQVTASGSYKCQFNLVSPQHPLVTVLKHDRNKSWNSVQIFIHNVLFVIKDITYDNKIELLHPVLIFILCNPSPSDLQDKNQLFRMLLTVSHEPQVENLLLEIISWQQLDWNYCWWLIEMSQHLLETKRQHYNLLLSGLAPFLAAAVSWLIINGHNPKLWLEELAVCLDVSGTFEPATSVLHILADVIMVSPAVYVNLITDFCKSVILKHSCNKLVAYKVLAAVLNWMVSPTKLAEPLQQTSQEMVEFLNSYDGEWSGTSSLLLDNKYFSILKNSNASVKLAFNLSVTSDSWIEQKQLKLRWLENLAKCDQLQMKSKLYLFLSGMVISEEDETVIKLCLQNLEELISNYPTLSFSLLCVIFFKLSKETDPSMQLKYLSVLPKLAVEKENMPLIVGVMEILKKGKPRIMFPLAIRLYLALWKVENRSYPYLYKMLTSSAVLDEEERWEVYLSKTMAMREICSTAPKLHGKDLVGMLSEVLNLCGDDSNGLPSALAIDSITELCEAHVIDVAGTWRALEPKLGKDKRPVVVISLCRMLSKFPSLLAPELASEALISDAIVRLWSYVCSEEVFVAKAAFAALGNFKPEMFKLKHFPQTLLKNWILSPALARTSDGRKAEDVFVHVPGECWIALLKNIRPELSTDAADMLVQLLDKELESLPRGMFNLSELQSEPLEYKSLPYHSICNALIQHIRAWCDKLAVPNSVEQCLRIVASEKTRCLPPLNLNFLLNLQTSSVEVVVKICWKGSTSSMSAKNIIEDRLKQFSPDKADDVIFLYSLFPKLCNFVRPNNLRIFVRRSVEIALQSALEGETGSFFSILTAVKMTLREKSVDEPRKTILIMQLESIAPAIPADSEVMKSYSDCVAEFPQKFIDRMSCPSLWKQVTGEKLHHAIAIRSRMALRAGTKKPLSWLNECIDVARFLPEEQTYILRSLLSVLLSCRSSCGNQDWLVDLMGRTQAAVSSEEAQGSLQLTLFLVDIFMSCIILFSGQDCLAQDLEDIVSSQDHRFRLFPISLYDLSQSDKWTDLLPQIVEWMHRLSNWKDISPFYSEALHQGIKALKCHSYCTLKSKWPRLFYIRR